MKIHAFQHVPFEDLASISAWAKKNGHETSYTRFFAGETPPELSQIDFLVVLGGPMSVNDEEVFSWLKTEKEALRAAIHQKIPVLGLCLGSQMISDVLGGKVYPNDQKEIGWSSVKLTQDGVHSGIFEGFDLETLVFEWHGDTFTLPEGAVNLASNDVAENQALHYTQDGAKVLGLQFHFEYSKESIETMIIECADELVDAPFISSAEEIRHGFVEKNHERLFENFNRLMDNLSKLWF